MVHAFNDAISIDHIVPERDVVTARRNRYILTITDLFSGYVVAIPTKTQESEESYRCIMHHWILRFGYPKECLADNAPGFSSEFFQQILLALGIKPTHGTPYKCATTSKAERSNKRVNQALRVTLDDKKMQDWDLYLNYVCFALNSIKSRHTGFTANMIVFGKELNTPLSLLCENEEPNLDQVKNKSYAAAIREHHRMVKDITSRARKHAARDVGYADNTYNRNVRGPFFQTGDYCFVLVDCPQHKFSKRWRGPYRINRVINDHLYVVEMQNEDKICNISKLKHYRANRFSQVPKSKFLAASTQTDATPTAVSSPTADLVITTSSLTNHDVNIPANSVIPPNTDSPQIRQTDRKSRVPDIFQAGFN
jgi:transposase InsO family protein